MNNLSLYEGKLISFTALDPEKDAETLSKWSNSPEFVYRNFEGIFRQYTVGELKKKLKEDLKKADETRRDYYFAVREKETEKMVALSHIGWILASHQAAFLFLDFENEAAVARFSGEVIQMTLRYAFMELSLHRLSLFIPSYNEAEIDLYEKAGFLRETQRRDAVFYDGRYYDELVYALLKPEWKKLNVEVVG